MKKTMILVAISILMFAFPSFSIEISLGLKETDLKLLTAADVPENFGRGLPMGPSSARFIGQDFWVVDSLKGEFIKFDDQGKPLVKIPVKNGEKYLFADFAIQTDAKSGSNECIWAIGSEKTNIVKILPDGKVISEFTTGLSMPCQLELMVRDQVLVFDEGSNEIVAFSVAGKRLWRQKTVGGKFLRKSNRRIIFIGEEKGKLTLLERDVVTGKIGLFCSFPLSIQSYPELLLAGNSEEVFVSFKSFDEKTGDATSHIGKLIKGKSEIESISTGFPAKFINRMLIQKNGQIFIVTFNEENKTKQLKIVPFETSFSSRISEG